MEVERRDDGGVVLRFEVQEGFRLAEEVAGQLDEAMPRALLDLANLLHTAKSTAEDDFRQPPDPWAPGRRHPST